MLGRPVEIVPLRIRAGQHFAFVTCCVHFNHMAVATQSTCAEDFAVTRLADYIFRPVLNRAAVLVLCIGSQGSLEAFAQTKADDAQRPGVGLTDPTLAFGLMTVSDWSSEMPFLDLAKTMRRWIGHSSDSWEAMNYRQLQAKGSIDKDGWVKNIPAGLKSVGTIWDWSADRPDYGMAASRIGTYVLTYSGKGTLDVWGSDITIQSESPGPHRFQQQQRRGDGIRHRRNRPGRNRKLHSRHLGCAPEV